MEPGKQSGCHGAGTSGFSFVELLVALVVSAMILTAAVIAFGTLATMRTSPVGATLDVTLSAGILNNFYGMTNSVISVETAPSYGEMARAESMREALEADIAGASAIFILARNGRSAIRPSSVAMPVGTDPRFIVSPGDFRPLVDPGGATFGTYTGAATNFANSSVFVISPGNSTSSLNVRSVYELDVVPAIQPGGVYASVRRYQGGALSAFYHVFYQQTNASAFRPVAAYFERSALSSGTANITNAFRVAANRPFYFLWWPDPAQSSLSGPAPGTFDTVARSLYTNMADATAFFFVVPAFPAL